MCQLCNLSIQQIRRIPCAYMIDVGTKIRTVSEIIFSYALGIGWSNEALNQICLIPTESFPCVTNNRKCFPFQLSLY